MANEMSHCLCLVVTSRALSSVDDIHVVHMLVKSFVYSGDWSLIKCEYVIPLKANIKLAVHQMM